MSIVDGAVLFPFPAQAGMVERLEWRTDVHESHYGLEKRVRVRNAPRAQYRMTCPIPWGHQARAVNTLYGGRGMRNWWVPLWAEAHPLAALQSGATSLTFPTELRQLRSERALLWGAPDAWEVVSFETVSPAGITLTAPTTRAYGSAMVVPLLRGRLLSDPRRTTDGHTSRVDLTLESEDNVNDEPAAAAPWFELYLDNEIGELQHTQQVRVDVEDYDAGLVEQFVPWIYARGAYSYRRVLQGLDEVYNFKQWLHFRAGRFRGFWKSSGEHDVRILSVDDVGTGTATISVRDDAYTELGLQHRRLRIEHSTGNILAVVDELVSDGEVCELELSTGVSTFPAIDQIHRISFVSGHRLDTDVVELVHVGNGVVTTSFNVVEILGTDPLHEPPWWPAPPEP